MQKLQKRRSWTTDLIVVKQFSLFQVMYIAYGGIWKIGLTADGILTEEKSIIVKNGTDNVASVQGMAVWNEADGEILFSDSKHGSIERLSLASGQKENFSVKPMKPMYYRSVMDAEVYLPNQLGSQ